MTDIPKDLADKLMRRLSKARTSLVLEHPFVGNLVLGMDFELCRKIPTAGTNGVRVRFNPDFIANLPDDQLLFLVAHETFHPMFEHNFRRGDRQAYRWNMAGDYVINQVLTEEQIGTMIPGALLDHELYTEGKGTTEGIYDLLPEQPEGGGGGYGGDGEPLDDIEDGASTPAEREQAAAEWRVKVAQAAQAAKMAGKLSANMERLVGSILKPKVNWREVMQRFVERCRQDSRTWSRMNRRFIAQDIYMPSVSGEAIGEVVFAIDCSGSIGAKELDQFAAEVRVVKDDMHPTKLHVIYFDSEVCHHDEFEQDDNLHIQPHGGGGTAFSPVFREIQKKGIQPVACVFLTDLYCHDFGPCPDYPVLWVSNGREEAPFGEVVMM